MGPIALFGIENSGLALAVNLLLLFLVVIWLALVYWTYSDARRRIADPMLVGCATAASLFPFIGTIVYLIVRPPEYLEDVHERELEIAAAQARLATLEHQHCQYCGFEIEKRVPALPELPAPAEGALHRLREAARPALEDLPVLRVRGRPALRGPPPAAQARRVGPGAHAPVRPALAASPSRPRAGRHGGAARAGNPRPAAVGRLAGPSSEAARPPAARRAPRRPRR